MESFRYFLNIDINKTINITNKNTNNITNKNTNNIVNDNTNVTVNNNTNVTVNDNIINEKSIDNYKNNYEDWSFFHNQEKKIIIKRNIGKLIGYCGDTITQIRKKNSNIIIKIQKSNECNSNVNREIILYGPQTGLKNVISEFKSIIGEENLVY